MRVAWAPVLLLLAACASKGPLPKSDARIPEHLTQARFSDLAGWQEAKLSVAVETFRRSCLSIPGRRDRWAAACSAAVPVPRNEEKAAREFFERWFDVFRVSNGGSVNGTFTGYYEAEIEASRERSKEYRYPVFGRPRNGPRRLPRRVIEACADDWVRALEEKRRPSNSRACRIVRGWPILMWANNRIDLFITEIQGSARVKLDDGTITRIGYAGQNGHRYVAVGKLLIDRDIIEAKDMSMQAIRRWLIENPRNGSKLMHENPSFVFFQERKENADEIGPRGALNMPLTPGRSIAVDPRYIPLGAPVWLATTYPSVPPKELAKAREERRESKKRQIALRPRLRSAIIASSAPVRANPTKAVATPPAPDKQREPETPPQPARGRDEPEPLRRLLIAQDTGGVIKGPVRGDVYWGTGREAFLYAGYMNQTGRWFVLLPKGYYGRLASLSPEPAPSSTPKADPTPARRGPGILPKWLRF